MSTQAHTPKRQSKKLSQSGSFVNWLASNNESTPVVGQGGTRYWYTDRTAFEVLSVSKDGTKVEVADYDAERIDSNGMSECQAYKYEKLGTPYLLVWRWFPGKKRGAWYQAHEEVVFTKQLVEAAKAAGSEWNIPSFIAEREGLTEDEVREQLSPSFHFDKMQVVDGWTRKTTKYMKVAVSFGVKHAYYDFSF